MSKPAMNSPHPFGDLIGLTFTDQCEGRSRCYLDADTSLNNPHNVVHGAVLYAMADTGMGLALYTLLQDGELCATIEIKISYFKPVRGGRITCDTMVVNKGRRVATLESELQVEGVLVAKAAGSFSIFTPSRRVPED